MASCRQLDARDQARLLGSPRHVWTIGPRLGFSSFYDLAPTADYLRKVVDFGRLNSGEVRFTVAATDIERWIPGRQGAWTWERPGRGTIR